MKKALMFAVLLLAATASFAQTTKYNFQETQARLLDVTTNAFIRPLVVNLEVDMTKGNANGRVDFSETLSMEQARAMENYGNIRSHAVYMACQQYDCDVIVAGTFNIYSDGNTVKVSLRGFPANFKGWKTAQQTDLDWIKIMHSIDTSKSEYVKTNPVRK